MPTIELLAPAGMLVALTAVAPLAAIGVVVLNGRRAAASLSLPRAPLRSHAATAAAAAVACILLGVAAARPVLVANDDRRVRSSSEVFFVVDVSRSMAATAAPGSPTRLIRAREAALALRREIDEVPAGVAGLTDRVLPYVFPTVDEGVFAAALRSSVALESPPPQGVDTVVSTFEPLAALARDGYFAPGAVQRTCVLLTDGEFRAAATSAVAAALRGRRGCRLLAVRFGAPGERVFRPDGRPEANYLPDPAAAAKLERLAAAAGGIAVDERRLDATAAALREAAAAAPTGRAGRERKRRALAPAAAGTALALVLALVVLDATRRFRRETLVYDGDRVDAGQADNNPSPGRDGAARAGRAHSPDVRGSG